MIRSDRRLDPPREIHRLRLVRATDKERNLRARDQIVALMALIDYAHRERP